MSTLKVAFIPEHFSTPLFFAEQQGYYKSRDLTIEFVKVPEGSGRLINLLNANEVDIAIGLTEAFVADIAKGNEKVHILDTYVKSPLLWAVSTGYNRDDIVDTTKLSKIGVSRIGSGSYIMSFVLAHQLGVPSFSEFPILSNFKNLRDSVNLKEGVEGSDAFMWEYFTSKKYYDNKEIKKIDQIYTPWSSWVISSSSTALNEKSKQLKDFISAVNEGIQYYNTHVDEAVEYISTNLDYSAEDAREWTKTVEFNKDLGEVPLDWETIVVKTKDTLKLAGVLTDSDDVLLKRLDANVQKTNL
ncbi:hypothetical protein SBY92_002020 [Candida maltosa Xu316]|uniref:Putative thiamine biosynthesis enzyme n=1 Tax=Candida maltosa (strain Xu316) TaxID=1245528 RepID=M3K0F9_CANMX|nr:putative thiamine biosynthesis enzyme [Candida maltosa Xu316]